MPIRAKKSHGVHDQRQQRNNDAFFKSKHKDDGYKDTLISTSRNSATSATEG